MSSIIPSDLENVVDEYLTIRPLMTNLHTEIGKMAKSDAILSCAKRLKMLSKEKGKKVVTFENEEESCIFQDYLIYMYRPRGINLVQQMLNRNRFHQDSGERQLLDLMVNARFSVFLVKQIVKKAGFIAMDIYTGEEFLVLDQTMPQNDAVGMLMGFRIFKFHNTWMHTGAWLILGQISDIKGFEPQRVLLDEKQEQLLNEECIFQWRNSARSNETYPG